MVEGQQMIPECRVKEYGVDFLNSYLRNKQSVYDFLTNVQNLYLPSFESKAVTDDYLLNILQKKVFIMKREEVHPAPFLKVNVGCLELIEEIKILVGERELGFDIVFPPDKFYLVNTLYSLDKNHKFFTIGSDQPKRLLDQE